MTGKVLKAVPPKARPPYRQGMGECVDDRTRHTAYHFEKNFIFPNFPLYLVPFDSLDDYRKDDIPIGGLNSQGWVRAHDDSKDRFLAWRSS